MTIPVLAVSPALFAIAPSAGRQNQGAILNQDHSANSAGNPASTGDVVSIFATGGGQTNPPGVDGQMSGGPPYLPLQPASIQIGGIDAAVIRANVVAGVLVIDVRIPADAPRSAAVPVVFGIGGSSSQAGVVMAIK